MAEETKDEAPEEELNEDAEKKTASTEKEEKPVKAKKRSGKWMRLYWVLPTRAEIATKFNLQ